MAKTTASTIKNPSSNNKKKNKDPPHKKKKQQKQKKIIPKPGEAEYKTATQLRNARKRRQKKSQKQNNNNNNNNNNDSQSCCNNQNMIFQDPSMKYISNPKAAPIVKQAIQFFASIIQTTLISSFPITISPTTKGWRTVTKLAVRKDDKNVLQIGLFLPKSHSIISAINCPAHHVGVNTAISVIQQISRQLQIEPYNETTGIGYFRHLTINIERSTGHQQVVLVWNDDDDEENNNENNNKAPSQATTTSSNIVSKKSNNILLSKLCNALIEISNNSNDNRLNLHSLWVHYNHQSKHANSIYDYTGTWKKVHGQDYIVETLDKVVDNAALSLLLLPPLHFPPQVFRQANLDAFTNIIKSIRCYIQKKIIITKKKKKKRGGATTTTMTPIQKCVELYGGVGTIGLHLLDFIQESFVSSDENPYNKVCFEGTVSEMKQQQLQQQGDKQLPKFITYESKNAIDMVQSGALDDANLIIVDPPRKGLEPIVSDCICTSSKPTILVYVSCGFDAFKRDYTILTSQGNWKLDHAEGHLLFPGSDAIETLAIFTRCKK